MRATPLSRAACATASAAVRMTFLSNAIGMMYSAVSSSSETQDAIAFAAGGDFTLKVSVDIGRLRRPGVPVFTGENAAVWRRRQKGARAPYGSLAPS